MNEKEYKRDSYSPRELAWIRISNLFIDEEYDDEELEGIASGLKHLGFSKKELDNIYLHEVAPVTWGGAIAGIWPCFDEEWLIKSINDHINSPKYKSILLSLPFRLFSKKWKKVKRAL